MTWEKDKEERKKEGDTALGKSTRERYLSLSNTTTPQDLLLSL